MLTCEECGKECSPHSINTGLGAYEYWGQQCHDVVMAVESDCCDSIVLKDDGDRYTFNEWREDNQQ